MRDLYEKKFFQGSPFGLVSMLGIPLGLGLELKQKKFIRVPHVGIEKKNLSADLF